MKKIKTIDMEIALANYFNFTEKLIVPNVFWGMFNYELDLLVITKSDYAWEIEIKVSLSDLKKDKFKRHGHNDYLNRIKYLYFAIPYYLKEHIEHIPKRAGIIVVDKNMLCGIIRKPKKNKNSRKLTNEEKFKIARLGAIRIWNLKRKISRRQRIKNGTKKKK